MDYIRATGAISPESVRKSRIKYNKMYKRVTILGYGSFGISYIHRRTSDRSMVVIKDIDLYSKCRRTNARSFTIQAAMELINLSHTNLVKHLNTFTLDNRLLLVKEYSPSSENLHSFLTLKMTTPLEGWEVLVLFHQIVAGLDYLHSEKIIHSNLKVNNVLVRNRDAHVKIGDYGLVQFVLDQPGALTLRRDCKQEKVRDFGQLAQLATLACCSPEVCAGRCIDYFKSDIWSLGCILYHIITQRPMFSANSRSDLINLIEGHKFEPIEDSMASPKLRHLFEKLVARNPSERPTSDMLVHRVQRLMNDIHLKLRKSGGRNGQNDNLLHCGNGSCVGGQLTTTCTKITTNDTIGEHSIRLLQSKSKESAKDGSGGVKNKLSSLVYQVQVVGERIQVRRVNFISAGKRIKMIVRGKSHYLMLDYDGVVHGWGSRNFGQLGACEPLVIESDSEESWPKTNLKQRQRQQGEHSVEDEVVSPYRQHYCKTPFPRRTLHEQPSNCSSSPTIYGLLGGTGDIHKPPSPPDSSQVMLKISASTKGKPFILNELIRGELRITQVAAGNNFSVFLTETGEVLTCGSATSGCLGRVMVKNENENENETCSSGEPREVVGLDTVTWISAGPEHVVAVCANGKAFAWGKQSCGCLGVNPTISSSARKRESSKLKKLASPIVRKPRVCHFPKGVKIRRAFCGDKCTVFLDSNRNCWACGENASNRMGLDVRKRFKSTVVIEECWIPTEITPLFGYRISSFSIGKNHSLIVTREGQCLVLGEDVNYSHLMHSIDATSILSHQFSGIKRVGAQRQQQRQPPVIYSSRGASDYKLMVKLALKTNQISGYKLSVSNSSNCSKVYIRKRFNRSIRRQLRWCLAKSRAIKRIHLEGVKGIACSSDFSVALTRDNQIYFWGLRALEANLSFNRQFNEIQDTELAHESEQSFVKIGNINESLLDNVQKFGFDRAIITVKDPRQDKPRVPVEFRRAEDSTSISQQQPQQSATTSDSFSAQFSAQNSNRYDQFGIRRDVIAKPQSILRLHLPSLLGAETDMHVVHLTNLYCCGETKFLMVLDTSLVVEEDFLAEKRVDYSTCPSDFSPLSPVSQHEDSNFDSNVSLQLHPSCSQSSCNIHEILQILPPAMPRKSLSTSYLSLAASLEAYETTQDDKCSRCILNNLAEVDWPECDYNRPSLNKVIETREPIITSESPNEKSNENMGNSVRKSVGTFFKSFM